MIFVLIGFLAGLDAVLVWKWWVNYCKYRTCLYLLRRSNTDAEFDRLCEQVTLELKLGHSLPETKKEIN
jgi:hypothetical protein